MATHSSVLAWRIQGQRSLVGGRLWGRTESDTTERLRFHFSLSCIGKRNGNPLQCSCLENPRDGGAWWAAISGVAQSRTRLKRLSSSSSSSGLNSVVCPESYSKFPLAIYFTYGAAAAKSRQSCPTPCNPIDGSPPGSPIPGILQARTLEWVAISFSNA